MGEKEKQNEGQKKGDGGKKDDGPPKVVMKVDLHCEGCVQKVKKSLRGFEGVEDVNADINSNKLTVIGKVDPAKIRDRVEKKIKKKVELISPAPKKEKDGGGDKKNEDKPPEKKPEEKKNKEPQVTTVVMKIRLHCEGCIKRIRRTISKFKGVDEMSFELQKDLVTVKGTMDGKALQSHLKDKLNRSVEIVPPAKKDDGKKDGGGGGGEKKKGEGGGDGKGAGGGEGGKKEADVKPLEHIYGQGYPFYAYPPVAAYPPQVAPYQPVPAYPPQVTPYPPPHMFSDENPNACSIM